LLSVFQDEIADGTVVDSLIGTEIDIIGIPPHPVFHLPRRVNPLGVRIEDPLVEVAKRILLVKRNLFRDSLVLTNCRFLARLHILDSLSEFPRIALIST